MNFKTGKTSAERHSPWPAPCSRLRLATRVWLRINEPAAGLFRDRDIECSAR
jgi:hypothetical protein